MEITVNIQAPAITEAIKALADALKINKMTQIKFEPPVITPTSPEQRSAAIPQTQAPVTASNPIQTSAPMPATTAVPLQTPVPVQTSAAPAPAAVVPTTPQTYSMDQLAVAATQLMDAGRRNELVQLLASFGVQALTALPKEQYGAFATQLRALGAKL